MLLSKHIYSDMWSNPRRNLSNNACVMWPIEGFRIGHKSFKQKHSRNNFPIKLAQNTISICKIDGIFKIQNSKNNNFKIKKNTVKQSSSNLLIKKRSNPRITAYGNELLSF